MSTKPASISLLTDRSGSMGSISSDSVNTNLQLLQTDSNTFMSIMQNTGVADGQLGQIGLVQFNSAASVLFPLASLDAGNTVLGSAIIAINGITASGSTNITDSITKGHAMLAGVNTGTYNRAMVLFSDGMYNVGGDPTNPPTDIPIYAIGYGSSSQLSYLGTIASKTGGQYHVTGDPGILATFYNDIIQEVKVADTVANAHMAVGQYGIFSTNANVPVAAGWHIFVATWADSNLSYTGGTPGPGQVQVVLNDPSGTVVSPDKVDSPAGSGYAILTVNNPSAGTWKVTTHPSSFSSSAGAIGAAHGIFTTPSSLGVELAVHSMNSPLHISARLFDGEHAIEGAHIRAHSKHQKWSHDELLDMHRSALDQIRDNTDFDDDVHQDEMALRILNTEKPELQIFRHEHQAGDLVSTEGGNYLIKIEDHKKDVPNTVYVEVHGISPVSGKAFQRTRLITVVP